MRVVRETSARVDNLTMSRSIEFRKCSSSTSKKIKSLALNPRSSRSRGSKFCLTQSYAIRQFSRRTRSSSMRIFSTSTHPKLVFTLNPHASRWLSSFARISSPTILKNQQIESTPVHSPSLSDYLYLENTPSAILMCLPLMCKSSKMNASISISFSPRNSLPFMHTRKYSEWKPNSDAKGY